MKLIVIDSMPWADIDPKADDTKFLGKYNVDEPAILKWANEYWFKFLEIILPDESIKQMLEADICPYCATLLSNGKCGNCFYDKEEEWSIE